MGLDSAFKISLKLNHLFKDLSPNTVTFQSTVIGTSTYKLFGGREFIFNDQESRRDNRVELSVVLV